MTEKTTLGSVPNPRGDAETMIRAGTALSLPSAPLDGIDLKNGTPYTVAPSDYAVNSLEHLLPTPTRKRGHVSLLDAASLIAYTKDQGSLAHCRLYADVDYEQSKCNLVAIIDDHGSAPEEAQWREHRATFAPKLSIEWKRWLGAHKKEMPQADFATFIEENLGDIASVNGSPTGAQMLEMALAFEATSEKRFKRRIDLQAGGVQLEYVDKADDTTSARMRMFERFAIGIPVFQGSASAYPVEARLKFRQANESLKFWYELIRPDRIFRLAVDDDLKAIKEATGFPLLYGTP